MNVTATETDWLSPELQMASVSARQILKVPGSDEHRNTLLGIVGFHQGKERGDDCVRIGSLAYKMSKQHDVESGQGQIWCTAMMQLDSHPIRSRKAFVGDTYSSGSHIYPEDWDCIHHAHIILATLLNNAVRSEMHSGTCMTSCFFNWGVLDGEHPLRGGRHDYKHTRAGGDRAQIHRRPARRDRPCKQRSSRDH